MQQPNTGDVFGKLEVLSQVLDGRWRCRCRGCGNDGTVISAMALNRGSVRMCWDCTAEAKRSRPQSARPIVSVIPIRVRKDSYGWSIPEAA
jgi:hypothetical protein